MDELLSPEPAATKGQSLIMFPPLADQSDCYTDLLSSYACTSSDVSSAYPQPTCPSTPAPIVPSSDHLKCFATAMLVGWEQNPFSVS